MVTKTFNGKIYTLFGVYKDKKEASFVAKELRYTSPIMHKSVFARVENNKPVWTVWTRTGDR